MSISRAALAFRSSLAKKLAAAKPSAIGKAEMFANRGLGSRLTTKLPFAPMPGKLTFVRSYSSQGINKASMVQCPAKAEGAFEAKPELRLEYEERVKAIAESCASMLVAGKSEEEVAEWAHEQRRGLGQEFKDKTDPDLRDIIYKRNKKVYGDELGPKFEDLKRGAWIDEKGNSVPIGRSGKKKTAREIIDAAAKPGGADFPWDLIGDYGKAKASNNKAQATLLLQTIDLKMNGPPKS